MAYESLCWSRNVTIYGAFLDQRAWLSARPALSLLHGTSGTPTAECCLQSLVLAREREGRCVAGIASAEVCDLQHDCEELWREDHDDGERASCEHSGFRGGGIGGEQTVEYAAGLLRLV